MKEVSLLDIKQSSSSGLFCNAVEDGSKPVKMQRTEKTKERRYIIMKKWLLTCSIDAVDINFETVLFSEEEPVFWTCEEIAQANGCDFWTVCKL